MMKRLRGAILKTALRVVDREIAAGRGDGVKAALVDGESGWVSLSDAQAVSVSGYASIAGKTVSGAAALEISAAWDCVKKTSELISTLPLVLYERAADGSKTPLENDLAEVLTIKPNPWQTAQEFWEGMTAQKLLRGNAYAEKLFQGPRLIGLRPMFNVTPRPRLGGGFDYVMNDRGRLAVMPPEKVYHLRGFGAGDGLGLSAIKYGANSLGAALAADETAGAVFSNGMMASGVLSAEQTLTEVQRAQVQSMLTAYTGSSRAGKIMVLEAGLKYGQLQMNPEDAQLLETRRFNVEDVCRWFGVPPIIIGHAAAGQTMWGSGVEAIMLSWLTVGINPQLVKIEARAQVDLVPADKRRRWSLHFDREAMLQMDSKSKGEFLSKMGASGTMTAHERRDKLNLPRHPDPKAGDLFMQGAMAPLGDLGEAKTNGQ